MGHPEPVHTSDLIIDALVAVGQIAIGRCLYSDGRPRWSKPLFRSVIAAFYVLCLFVAGGMIVNIIRPLPDPAARMPLIVYPIVSSVELIWGLTSTVAIVVYLLTRALLRRLPEDFSPARRTLIKATAGAVVAAPVAALAYGGFVERKQFHVVEVDFPVSGLHPDFEGFTIAQISDLHVSPFLSVRDAARVVDMANELKPRLTLVTGDLITGPGDPLDATIRELARLRADTGVLGCLGNHERFGECEDQAEREARRYGIEFLRMKTRRIHWGQGEISFAGVDYQPFRDKAHYLKGADKLIANGVPNILLSHNPDVFPVATKQGYDATIAGHTHAGQVTVEILRQNLNVVRFLTPYVAGLYRENGASCYVTAGIGTIGMPVRLGAQPELTLLRLRRA